MKKSRILRVTRVPTTRKRRNLTEFEKLIEKLEIPELITRTKSRAKSPFRSKPPFIKTLKKNKTKKSHTTSKKPQECWICDYHKAELAKVSRKPSPPKNRKKVSRRAIFEPGGTMKSDSGLLISQTNTTSFRSSTVLGSLEELSTEKRKRGIGVISPAKRALIRTIKKNGRVL